MDIMASIEREQKEKKLQEEQGNDYRAPYQAHYSGSTRQTRLQFVTGAMDGMESGFMVQYIHLDPIEYTGGELITFNYRGEVIAVRGRNLHMLISEVQGENVAILRAFNDGIYRNDLKDIDPFIESIQRMKITNR